MADYSIWVLEFARAPESLAAFLIHGQPGVRELPFSITVMQSDRHTVLVDVGHLNAGDTRVLSETDGVTVWTHPRVVLGRIGIDPREVDTILLTHAHYDHVGDLEGYPNAVAYLQQRELEKWRWALSLAPEMQWLKDGVNPADLDTVESLHREGRLRLVDGPVAEVLPGVSLEPDFDTHTYGHQHVVVENVVGGRWVLPGDACYTYANVEGVDGSGRYVPIGYATGSQEKILMALDRMMRVVGGDSRKIIPGHECLLWARHPSRVHDDGLYVAEITLRPGDHSRL